MLGVGSHLPSDQDCAARVQHNLNDQQETRPQNTPANQFVPDRVVMPVWTDFTAKANQQFVSRIDGHFTGTTAQILDWGACKWGVPPICSRRSRPRKATGDKAPSPTNRTTRKTASAAPHHRARPASGSCNFKHTTLPGTYPLSVQSTAFNVDYYGARIRSLLRGLGYLPARRLRR